MMIRRLLNQYHYATNAATAVCLFKTLTIFNSSRILTTFLMVNPKLIYFSTIVLHFNNTIY